MFLAETLTSIRLFSPYPKQTCKMANSLRRMGVRKHDVVTLYMPMIPEAVYAMLACARLGAVHRCVRVGMPACVHEVILIASVLACATAIGGNKIWSRGWKSDEWFCT